MKVKVRVAVAVDPKGHWNACGWGPLTGESAGRDAMDLATEVVEEGEKRYWLEAELDVPVREEITVQAEASEVK